MFAVDPSLFADIQGSTDSEVLFHLALTFGLEDDPVRAMERAVGLVEATADAHGIAHAVQASIGLSDGERLWAFRYSTEREVAHPVRLGRRRVGAGELHPENAALQRLARRGQRGRLRAVGRPARRLGGASPSRPC